MRIKFEFFQTKFEFGKKNEFNIPISNSWHCNWSSNSMKSNHSVTRNYIYQQSIIFINWPCDTLAACVLSIGIKELLYNVVMQYCTQHEICGDGILIMSPYVRPSYLCNSYCIAKVCNTVEFLSSVYFTSRYLWLVGGTLIFVSMAVQFCIISHRKCS